ncbi:MAG: SusE domain-containing protein [Flavisolibacter sp.]
MRKIISSLSFVTATVLFFAGCTKVKDLPHYETGNAVTLTSDKTAVIATAADSTTKVVKFSWTDPKYATDERSYKFLLQIDSAGKNFANPYTREVVGRLDTSFTGRELNSIVLNYGFAIGVAHMLDVRVISSYNNNNERYTSNIVKLAVTPFADPSVLKTSNTSVTGTLATASQLSNTFSWNPSFNGYPGVVTYTLEYDSVGKNFASPHQIVVGPTLYSKALNQGEMNAAALNEGIAGGSTGKIEYRIKASTAQGAIAYSNTVAVTIQTYVPLLRFYLPGGYQSATGNGADWDPPTAPEFVRDLRPGALNRLYYMYIYLPANSEFKVTQNRSWDINYGGTGGNLSTGGANLKVTTAGVYRISIDVSSMKYDIRAGRMGFVGDASGAGWNPPNVFPTYSLGAPANNLFVGLTNFTVGGWKLIDNDQWDNGSKSLDETRGYGSNGASGSSVEVNGPNFPNITTAGRYRVIWDGRDVNNVKYETSPATEMRVVGDGINQASVNDWDPASSPQMTYSGNGVWTITIGLKANKSIKFVAGNAWGAFDYEDNSGQSQALGTARKIKWDGGSDFKTPAAAGTYTITLDERAQTVTIN